MLLRRWLLTVLVVAGLMASAFGQDKKDPDKKEPAKTTADKKEPEKKEPEKKEPEKKEPEKKEPEKKEPEKKEAPKAGDTVTLKWKFEKNKPFYQAMTTTTKQNMTVMGMKISQSQTQTFYFSWTPKEEKDGTWTIAQKIEGVKMEIEIGGNPITYDSTKPAAAASPLSDFFKALVGAEFTLTLSPKNEVTDIKGKDEFLKKLISANQQMEPLLKQILSDDALKQMADPAFSVVPDHAVKKGDTWEKNATLNMGPIGTYKTTYKYKYEGKDEKDAKLDKITVETKLEYSPPGPGAMGNLPFKIVSADLKTTEASGKILFDNGKGRVASSDMSLKLAGTLKIDISGTQTDVTLDQTQTTTLKTTDENPVK